MKRQIIAAAAFLLTICLLSSCISKPDSVPNETSWPMISTEPQTTALTTVQTEQTTASAAAPSRTPLETVTEEGISFHTKEVFSEERKADILEASKALSSFVQKYMKKKYPYPDATYEIAPIESVHYENPVGKYNDENFVPDMEFTFQVICIIHQPDKPDISIPPIDGGCRISRVGGVWTTYMEYRGDWIQ